MEQQRRFRVTFGEVMNIPYCRNNWPDPVNAHEFVIRAMKDTLVQTMRDPCYDGCCANCFEHDMKIINKQYDTWVIFLDEVFEKIIDMCPDSDGIPVLFLDDVLTDYLWRTIASYFNRIRDLKRLGVSEESQESALESLRKKIDYKYIMSLEPQVTFEADVIQDIIEGEVVFCEDTAKDRSCSDSKKKLQMIRDVEKKLRQVSLLKEKQKHGEKLEKQQLEKLGREQEFRARLTMLRAIGI